MQLLLLLLCQLLLHCCQHARTSPWPVAAAAFPKPRTLLRAAAPAHACLRKKDDKQPSPVVAGVWVVERVAAVAHVHAIQLSWQLPLHDLTLLLEHLTPHRTVVACKQCIARFKIESLDGR
jgi:hypothetical protein